MLDETDSGLDIDALRVVADGVNSDARILSARSCWSRITSGCSTTSVPDVVHVLLEGRILRSGDAGLALELEERGYDWVRREARVA